MSGWAPNPQTLKRNKNNGIFEGRKWEGNWLNLTSIRYFRMAVLIHRYEQWQQTRKTQP